MNIKKIIPFILVSISFFIFVGCSAKNDLGGYKPPKGIEKIGDNYEAGLYLFIPDQYAFETNVDGSDEYFWCIAGEDSPGEHEKKHTFESAWIKVVNTIDQSNYLATNPKSPVYLFLNDNHEIEFKNGILYPIDVAPKIDYYREVMLQVGRDIEPGQYKIKQLDEISSPGYQVISVEELMNGKAYPGYSIYSTEDLKNGYSEPTQVTKVKYLPEYVELKNGDFILLHKYTGLQ